MTQRKPPMEVTDEATRDELELARVQGDAYGRALRMMTEEVADTGGEQQAGDFLIGFAIEQAEGLWERAGDEIVWREPESENVHIEIAVRDAADGRFVPGLQVDLTVLDDAGEEIGTETHRYVWHPMLYHYARNWSLPGEGEYTLRVRVEPAAFPRHDRVNGRRYTEPVEVEFPRVRISPGKG